MYIGIMALYGLMSTALERSVWMWGWSQELWDCEMNASVKQISSKISGLLLTIMFVSVCDSQTEVAFQKLWSVSDSVTNESVPILIWMPATQQRYTAHSYVALVKKKLVNILYVKCLKLHCFPTAVNKIWFTDQEEWLWINISGITITCKWDKFSLHDLLRMPFISWNVTDSPLSRQLSANQGIFAAAL